MVTNVLNKQVVKKVNHSMVLMIHAIMTVLQHITLLIVRCNVEIVLQLNIRLRVFMVLMNVWHHVQLVCSKLNQLRYVIHHIVTNMDKHLNTLILILVLKHVHHLLTLT